VILSDITNIQKWMKMKFDHTGFEENEISIKAFGGTELTKRGLAKYIDPDLLSNFQIICSRVRELDPEKIRIYYIHDLPEDPECRKIIDPNFRNQFHLIAFTSEWQYQRFQHILNLPYEEDFVVLDSGVEPIEDHEKPTDKINLIYSSTPQRGLALLLPVVDRLSAVYPEIHLHVFSSFKMYGWDEYDKKFDELYNFVRNHSHMTYHEFSGESSNDEVRAQLKQSHIFAYPCIWQETFCRSVVEAMSAKLLCVHPNYCALPFTTGGLNIMYPGDKDPQKHINKFAQYLETAIRMIKTEKDLITNRLMFNKAFVDTRFSMNMVARNWSLILDQLSKKYSTIESRKIPEQMFHYNTGG